ncbi:hypothetical protein BD779DRAFT_1678716 [Infundibulicybe gibba]|nr:hypothetical protein BD779DRAFT_1678716 [Infundibulicybe gibba]
MAFTLDAGALGTLLEGILYGAYMVLFILYLVLQHRNNRRFGGLTLAQMMLFGLCTVSLCVDIPTYCFSFVPDMVNGDIVIKLNISSLTIFATIDYLAQIILVAKLYRCWVIWDRGFENSAQLTITYTLAGGGFALTGLDNSPLWGIDEAKIIRLFTLTRTTTYSISLAVNTLTTSLIVIKIFLTSREVRPVSGSDSHQSLRIVIAMLIESGFLMLMASQLVFLVLFYDPPASKVIFRITTQIYVCVFLLKLGGGRNLIQGVQGITPTLLNIRVVMGTAYDKTAEKTRALKFARLGEAATQTTSPSMSVAGVQSWGMNGKLNDASNNERAVDDAV